MKDSVTNATVAASGKVAAYAGSSVAMVFGGLSISEWCAVVGALVAVAGLFVNVVFKLREERRREAAFLHMLGGDG